MRSIVIGDDGTGPFVFCYTLCGVAPNTPVEP